MLLNILNNFHLRYLLVKGFVLATTYKCMKDMSRVKLPEALITEQSRARNADSALVQRAIAGADALTETLVHFTTRKCFFRAFTAAYVLRKKGFAVTLNMGLHHLNKKDHKVRGHCWLSWEGQPVVETNDPRVRYHQFLGTGQNGVCYWLGGEKTDKRKIVHYRTAGKGPRGNAAFEN